MRLCATFMPPFVAPLLPGAAEELLPSPDVSEYVREFYKAMRARGCAPLARSVLGQKRKHIRRSYRVFLGVPSGKHRPLHATEARLLASLDDVGIRVLGGDVLGESALLVEHVTDADEMLLGAVRLLASIDDARFGAGGVVATLESAVLGLGCVRARWRRRVSKLIKAANKKRRTDRATRAARAALEWRGRYRTR